MRTDENNNPAAITVDVARQGGLMEHVDYIAGTPFPAPSNLVTAWLLGDPVALTIKVIDRIGYYTKLGTPRWTYIAMPDFVWDALSPLLKRQVIAFHYKHEGGTALDRLFR
jgi:hypothetical protein